MGLEQGRGWDLGQLTRAEEANLDRIFVSKIFVQLIRVIIWARKYLMFENIFWINHVHDTRWQVFSARSVQTSVKILGETEDNEKLIFSLDSGHNVWELGARQPGLWGACYKLFGLWPSPVLSVVVDTNPGKRGWREIIFRVNSQEKIAGKSFLWLVIIVFLRSPFEEMLVGYNYTSDWSGPRLPPPA